MAVVVHATADVSVTNIAARDSIIQKVDGMTCVVLDGIADPAAGPGIATYRWSYAADKWILISSESYKTLSFDTEELLITGGEVNPSNIPTNNQIWSLAVLDGNVVIAEPRLEDLTVTATSISGLNTWEGKKLRFTYAYGTVAQQIDTFVTETVQTTSGTAADFEGGL